ncbi:hypothetical protein FG386_000340 [Cryptosporidium ryanae]|uniref:uncharacterized protein n=1 Tax=Cryptosporidium ryanae TaxID=515981 RepID=UPI00351A1859|nr:hypothetical protein FG386_000340 [Cryptosporidium ryanae]
MRNIKFSSLSPKSIARNPRFPVEGHEKRNFNSLEYAADDHLTLKDYRFLPKINQETGTKSHLGGFFARKNDQNTYMRTNPVLQSSNDTKKNFTTDNIGFHKERHSSISGYGLPVGSLSGNYLSKGGLLGSDSYNNVSQMIGRLPLLPPNKYSHGTFEGVNANIGAFGSDDNTIRGISLKSNLLNKEHGVHGIDIHGCRKRPLEQVYRKKFDEGSYENEDDEFHDAISDDDSEIDKADVSVNSKRSILVPPSKKIYNNTPSTQAQTTGVMGTLTNTPNKLTNTYRLPLSLIEDDFRLEKTPNYNFTSESIQNSQRKLNPLELTQYSHPYNFNKNSSAFTALTREQNNQVDAKNHSSAQRIRTPLRYRSSLVGAVNSKANSSCKILSAAEMKRLFCKSRKPIGSLKDFVHTIDERSDLDCKDNLNSESNSVLNNTEKVSNADNDISEMGNKNNAATENNSGDNLSAASSNNLDNLESSNKITNKEHSFSELNSEKIEDSSVTGVNQEKIVEKPVTENENSLIKNDSLNDATLNSGKNVVVSEISRSVETDENKSLSGLEGQKESTCNKDSADAINQEKKEACEAEKDVPWWLVNVGKPNLVEVDNEGVFLSDEEDSSNKKEEKPSAEVKPDSSLSLFSVQKGDNTSVSLFSFANNTSAESNDLSQIKNKDSITSGLTEGGSQSQTNALTSMNATVETTIEANSSTKIDEDSENSNSFGSILSKTSADIAIESNATSGKTITKEGANVSNINDLSEKKVDLFSTLLTGNSIAAGASLFGVTPNTESVNSKGIFSDLGISNLNASVSSPAFDTGKTNNNKLQEIGSIFPINNNLEGKEQVKNTQTVGVFELKNSTLIDNSGSSIFGNPTLSTTNVVGAFQQPQLQNLNNSAGLFGTGPENSSVSSTGIFGSNGLFNNSNNANLNQVPLFGLNNTGDKGAISATKSVLGGESPNTTSIFGNISNSGIKKGDSSFEGTHSKPKNDIFGSNVFSSQSNSNTFQGNSIFGTTGLGVGSGMVGTGLGIGGAGSGIGVGAGGFGVSATPVGTNSIFNSQNQGSSAIGLNNAHNPNGSLFGMRNTNLTPSNCATSTVPFAANQGNTGLNMPFQVPPAQTNNVFSQAPVFGNTGNTNNSNPNPFAFGSNTNINNQQNSLQNANQNNFNNTPSSSSIFGAPAGGGIFGSAVKPETNIFGNIGNINQGMSSPFNQRPQQDITVQSNAANQSGIFGSNPPSILGAPQIISGNNQNPFVGHSSMQTGSSTHRRRIARAKRSH